MSNWKAHKINRGNWCITHNDQVQPFGAIFFNQHGDVGTLVEKAVARLNAGKRTFQGARQWYEVAGFDKHGIADIRVYADPECHRCGVTMRTGRALQNELVSFGGGLRGATCSHLGQPKMVEVWKCPECGHSFTK